MKLFREEEHPRDNDGKFTNKQLQDMSAKELSDKIKETIKLDNQKMVVKNVSGKNLTNKEFAVWSKKLADGVHGDFIKQLSDGHKVISTDKKVVFSTGSFEEPIIDKIIAFDDELELAIFMEIL